MSKHTPGPWEVRHESIDPRWAIVTTSMGDIVANVNAETGPDIPPLVTTKMPRAANAALIAAAPDLLAALEQIQTLNAGKDCDIAWLCEKAIARAKEAQG